MGNKKVLVAFSGGLDTTYCVKYLSEVQNFQVHTAIVNTGGFDAEELKVIEKKANYLGSLSHQTLDVIDRFYKECVRFLVFGNSLRNNTYPLSVSAERVFQAIALIEYAKKIGVDAIAHGSTGAGNDQIRFDLIFQVMAPEIEIITPIRDMQLSREAEITFLKEQGVEVNEKKSLYSINKGLWGTSVGGVETLTSDLDLPEEAWPTPVSKTDEEEIILHFEKGEFVGLNGKTHNPVKAINILHDIAAPFGIGRDIHVGDTIVGIKGRVGFEAAAPLIILKAHHLLEKHTLTKWQQHWKEQLGQWYGMMTHEGQFIDPVMRNIESFLLDTQDKVTGLVKVKLKPYHFNLVGIDSPNDLMKSDFGAYGEMNKAWSGEDAKGFTKILSNPYKLYFSKNESKGKK